MPFFLAFKNLSNKRQLFFLLDFISQSDPMIKFSSILEKVNVKTDKNASKCLSAWELKSR